MDSVFRAVSKLITYFGPKLTRLGTTKIGSASYGVHTNKWKSQEAHPNSIAAYNNTHNSHKCSILSMLTTKKVTIQHIYPSSHSPRIMLIYYNGCFVWAAASYALDLVIPLPFHCVVNRMKYLFLHCQMCMLHPTKLVFMLHSLFFVFFVRYFLAWQIRLL